MPNNLPDNAADVQPAPDTAGLSPQSPIPIPQADPNVQAPQPQPAPQMNPWTRTTLR
jgi:hypothetical protein